jgi:hypothetical protein
VCCTQKTPACLPAQVVFYKKKVYELTLPSYAGRLPIRSGGYLFLSQNPRSKTLLLSLGTHKGICKQDGKLKSLRMQQKINKKSPKKHHHTTYFFIFIYKYSYSINLKQLNTKKASFFSHFFLLFLMFSKK